MNFSFIKNLLDHAEAFSRKHPDSADMHLFAQFLGKQTAPAAPRSLRMPDMTPTETVESVIAKLLIFLNRYARGYLKKALEKTEVGSADEFIFLVNLFHRGSATKMELIERARLEKPTGMEVWRRLLAAGFVEQANSEMDRRSKKLTLSPTGRAALLGSFEVMHQVTRLLTGNLNEAEKHQLLELLQKLEDYHLPIRQTAKNRSWADIFTDSQMNEPQSS